MINAPNAIRISTLRLRIWLINYKSVGHWFMYQTHLKTFILWNWLQTCHLLIYETLQCIHKNEKSKVNNGFKSVTLVCKKQISKIQLSETAPMSTDKIIHGLSIYQKIKLSIKLKRNLWIQFLNDNMTFLCIRLTSKIILLKIPKIS